MRITLNGSRRRAFLFGRQHALRATYDAVDQLQMQIDQQQDVINQLKAQLSAERQQNEQEKDILVRDLLQLKYEAARRDVIDTFSKMASPSALLH
jgi:TolA-binding protein